MRIKKTPEERRNEIIDTAFELFVQNGIENTQVSAIVKKMGVAQGLFYYYFQSKDDVINAVIDHVFDELEHKIASIINDKEKNFYQKLIDYIDLYFKLIGRVGPHIIQDMRLPANARIHRHIENDTWDINERVVKQLLKIGVDEGVINLRYPNEMLMMILCGIDNILLKMDIDRDMLLYLIEQGLRLKPGSLTDNTLKS